MARWQPKPPALLIIGRVVDHALVPHMDVIGREAAQ